MFNTNIFDLLIGLVFIFTMYSLLASSFMEVLSGLLGLRSKMLEAAIINLFESKDTLTKQFFKRFMFFFWIIDRKKIINRAEPTTFSELFLSSPRILSFNRYNNKNGPSYLSAAVFSEHMIELLGKGAVGSKLSGIYTLVHSSSETIRNTLNVNIDNDLILILKTFLEQAEGDINKFKKKIEEWYDELMQRISGWYKRQARYIILVIGFIISVSFNVDTIKICEKLSADPKARIELVNSAVNMASTYESKKMQSNDSVSINKIDTLFNRTFRLMNDEISTTNNFLALGWGKQEWYSLQSFGDWLIKIVGLLLTTFAISLGSDFWFNLLKKLLNLKSVTETKSISNNSGNKT